MKRRVFVSGSTGFMGRALIADLLARGHSVHALARAGSEGRVPAGAVIVTGDALRAETFAEGVSGCDTYVHLVGTAKPAPWKAKQFRSIDRPSALASLAAARQAGVCQFVYLSVAHPAPIMRSYIAVRQECEQKIRASGLNATLVRPWYVLGPGRRWPLLLQPIYWLLEAIPATRERAERLGLVTLDEMVRSLREAVENPVLGVRIVETKEIRGG